MFEVPITDGSIAPGWSYDATNKQFSPCQDLANIKRERQAFRLEFNLEQWDEKKIYDQKENEAFQKERWVQDYIQEKATDAIFVRGYKVEEEKGVGIPTDDEVNRVFSIYYKFQACFLMLSTKRLSETSVIELKDYLEDAKNNSDKSSAPISICKQSRCIYIYGDTAQERTRLYTVMLGLKKFTDLLKASQVSSSPVSALIQPKVVPNVDLVTLETNETETSNDRGLNSHKSEASITGSNILKRKSPDRSLSDENEEPGMRELSSITETVSSSNVNNSQINEEVIKKERAEHCKHVNDSTLQVGDKNDGVDISEPVCENLNKGTNKSCNKRLIKKSQFLKSLKVNELSESSETDLLCESQKDPLAKDNVIKAINAKSKPRKKFTNKQKNLRSKDNVKTESSKKRKLILVNESSQKKIKSNLGAITLDSDDDDDYNIFPKIRKESSSKGKIGETKKDQKQMKSTLLRPASIQDDPCGFQRKCYGTVGNISQEKVILLLGASGSGKTMLVNFIANFFMEKKTVYELIHVEPPNPTTSITAYTFCQALDNVPITVIDTPGLNDASGAEVRDHVQTLKTFIANVSAKGYAIHAIGFVAQAHLVRLTSSERLVMDYVSTMFGECVFEHLITLITFADNQNMPPIIEAMRNYGVSFKLSLKFNNSALSSSIAEEIDDLDRVYWRVCRKNWKKCMNTLCNLPSLSVNAMKAVQNEIYVSTVIKSVEREMHAELASFFTILKGETYPSKEALEVCGQVWNLAAIIRHHRQAHGSGTINSESIVTEFALSTCQSQNLDPGQYIHFLSLSETSPLVVSGCEVIKIMAPLYTEAKYWNRSFGAVSKNISEWSYCYLCESEHKMERCNGYRKDIVAVKCISCKCPGDCHGPSITELPFHENKILEKTLRSLKEVIVQYSLPSFAIPENLFIMFLNQHLHCQHEDFLKALSELLRL